MGVAGNIVATLAAITVLAGAIGFSFWQRRRLLQVQAALHACEAGHLHLLAVQSDLVVRCNRDTTVGSANEAFQRYFGSADGSRNPLRLIDCVCEEFRELAAAKIDVAATELEPIMWECKMAGHGGTALWVQWHFQPVLDKQGHLLEIHAVGHNVSDRRRADEAQKKLSHALRLAVVGELTAMVAHEVSQPLGAIMANADAAQILLERDNPPLSELKSIVQDIRESDDRANQAISRIRSLLRPNELQLNPLSIDAIIVEALHLVNGDARTRGIKIHHEVNHQLPRVLGDHTYILQVLLNLIVNAMDAMSGIPQTQRDLRVWARADNADGVTVAISDKGPGIKEHELPAIFESFYSTKTHGMGLGLAICDHIIKNHQGKIWVENNCAGGATFRFSLPAA